MATIRMERQDTAALVDDADKLGKSLQNWCTIRRGQHASMQMEMQEEQKALQSAAKLMLSGTDLEIFKPASLVTFLQVAERHRTGTLWEAVVQPVSAGTRMRTTPPGNNVLSEESQVLP
ncbi:unnamed protein product [Symbiodinium sp. KB8]|nr:unnamed protein product [Symbiodinium sp. KB8]